MRETVGCGWNWVVVVGGRMGEGGEGLKLLKFECYHRDKRLAKGEGNQTLENGPKIMIVAQE